METSEVLNRAADLIQERGWGQGSDTWTVAGDGLCIEGAIAAVAEIPTMVCGRIVAPSRPALEACPAYRAVAEHLAERHHDSLWRWNDHRTRTADEVIEVLRAAAAIEHAREAAGVEVSA
jgi:hypothetical protein